MKMSFKRSVGALATVCAVLLVMANPAAAQSMTVTSGTVVVTKGVLTPQTIAIGGGTCTLPTIQADITSATTGTVKVTALNSTGTFLWSGVNYIATLTLNGTTATSGAYNHTTGTLATIGVPIKAQLYTVGTTACTPGTLLCTWTSTLSLTSINFTSHAALATANLTGTGTALALGGACGAPFSTYTGGAVAVTALNVLF